MKHKKIIFIIPITILFFIISFFITVIHVKTQVKDLFRMNKELQEEGYYMADFEFKMMGFVYWMDHGHYYTALTRFNQLYKQLKTRDGLIKVPKFTSKEDELKFYLNLQNPKTGAFMDDSYPYCTYNEPTENILAHLNELSEETGQQLRLKYPLKYLDEINTPKKLKEYLDDISYVGWIQSKFPQTTYVLGRGLIDYTESGNVLEEYNLYSFSSEWKQSVLQWFYDNQDPQTGFWGPRSRSNGTLSKKDLTNTASIIKAYVGSNGNNIYMSFPLHYKKEMFKTTLEVMSEAMPADESLDEWHEWSLKMGKGISMLTRYLWDDASQDSKARAKTLIESYVKTVFEKRYVSNEGAFSYYPNSKHATLDGTSGILNDFSDIGFYSAEKQQKLWGNAEENIIDLGVQKISTFTQKDLSAIISHSEINSLRFYKTNPDVGDLTADVFAIAYPHKTSVLDIMDFTPKTKHWLNTTSQSMGNWVSKDVTAKSINDLKINEVAVYKNEISYDTINDFLQKNKSFVVIGFDILQIPKYKIVFESEDSTRSSSIR